MSSKAPIPVMVVCGFLGAGKTTLLNRLLAAPMGRRLAVMVNDFGAINIDAELVATADESSIALTNGCICCSIRDDLALAMLQLRRDRPEIDHILIEASGISDPLGIADALFQPELSRHFRVDSLVAVADTAAYSEMEFHDAELVLRQTRVADLVLLNKCDIAKPAVRQRLERDIADMAPSARLYPTVHTAIPAEILFEPRDLQADLGTCRDHVSHQDHEHDEAIDKHAPSLPHGFSTRAWAFAAPLRLDAFTAFVRHLPQGIYRAKGILNLVDQPGRRGIFHLVGKRSSIDCDRPWNGEPGNRLVLIGRVDAADWAAIDHALLACTDGHANDGASAVSSYA
jgi:G3E family GTPase